MAQVKTVSGKKETWKERCARTAREVVKRRWLFFLLIPGIIFFAVFKYIPMYGLKIAFQDYNQYDPSKSQWVGFQQFMDLFSKNSFLPVLLIQTLTRQHIMVLTDSRYFVPMLIITDIYKGLGWGTIIYFAAISGIDPSLYEAAAIDGAGKWKQAINITLPCIVPTIIIQFILSSSNILNAGFDQIFMLYTSHVYDVADIIDTYVYRMGIINNDYSFSTAAGMFKSVVALIMILFVNQVAKRTGNEGLF